jgi:hypothetical protein
MKAKLLKELTTLKNNLGPTIKAFYDYYQEGDRLTKTDIEFLHKTYDAVSDCMDGLVKAIVLCSTIKEEKK